MAASLVVLICASLREAIFRVQKTAGALQRLGHLVDLSHDAILVWTPADGIEMWNRGAEELYGFSAEEAHGHISHDLLQTRFPRPWIEIEREVRQRGQWEGELAHTAKDGRKLAVATKLQQITIDGVERLLETNRDITDRRRAEEALSQSEARFHHLADALPQMVFEIDAEGTTGYFNENWIRFTGQQPGDIDSRAALVHPEDRPLQAARWSEAVRDGSPYECEYRFLRHDGEYRWVLARALPLRDAAGKVTRWFGTATDIHELRQTQERLRESQAIYSAVHDSAPFGIALTRMPERRFVSVNGAFLRIFELDRNEVIGKNSMELGISDPASRAFIAAELQQRGVVRDFEVTRRTRSGRELTLLLNMDKIEIAGGAFVLASVLDITLRKEAARERERLLEELRHQDRELRRISAELSERVGELQVLLDIAPAAIWITRDREGRTITGNAYADEVIMRVPRGSNVSHTAAPGEAAVCYRPMKDGVEIPGAELPAQKAAATGKPVPAEEQELIFEDGRRVQILVGAAPLFDACGRVRGSVTTGIDIGKLKQMEMALREADRRKTEFLAMLSHELRNPLAPITNSLYVLEHVAPGGDQARRAQEVIGRQVDQLVRMVDDLLEITRITRGKVQLRPQRLELNDLVRRTIEDHRQLFDTAGVRLVSDPAPQDVFINADKNRIAQVVANLLSNAVKFTPCGGRVAVTVDADSSSGWASVRFADTGTGIPQEFLPRLFEPFTQADRSLDRRGGGLGLGLALVKGLVEQHGGTIVASSEGPGCGSEFTVRLPLAPNEPARERSDRGARGAARRRVLVIDDNIDAADSLRVLLDLEGHSVEVAYDGPEGIAKALDFRPELVLCDIGLPEMDGFAVARALRAEKALETACLVALSGYALPEDLARAAAAGFVRHLAKPPSVEKLREVLECVAPSGQPHH